MKKLVFIFMLLAQSFLFADQTQEGKYNERISQFLNRYYNDYQYSSEITSNDNKIQVKLFLDQDKFTESDIDFIKAVIFTQVGLDKLNGETVDVFLSQMKNVMKQLEKIEYRNLENTQNNNLNILILLFGVFLGIFLIFFGFFVFYTKSMNRKIEQLILENRELAKKNILIEPQGFAETREDFKENEEQNANALLIASAPRMLEALEIVNNYFIKLQNKCALSSMDERAWKEVSFAIQLATNNS